MKKMNSHIASILNANTGLPVATPIFLEWVVRKTEWILTRELPTKKLLPHPTYTQGSWPNYAELIRYNEKLKKIMENTIEDPECLDPSIFDIPRIKEMLREHLNHKTDYTGFLFLLLTFGRWHKKHGPINSQRNLRISHT